VAFRVGFIGLGIMGSRMAANLQVHGYRLVVFNRSRDKAEALVRNGAIWGGTPEGMAGAVDVLFTMLSERKRIIHVGAQGLGSSLKMVNNLLAGVAMAAFAEGATLGQALGIPRQTIFDTFMGGPMVAPSVTAKRLKFEHDDYDTEFAMRWLHKDLHLAAISAYEADVPMSIVNATKELYGLAMRDGYADLDLSAIYAFLNRSGDREKRHTSEVVGASTSSAG
jgi:3-hydroxyisobutyrate dehydrogenase-like beta-hydroxyacid dehydrogenase